MQRFRQFTESEDFTIPKEHRRPIKIEKSPHRDIDVHGEFRVGNRAGKTHTVHVHPSKLRATQNSIDTRWKPGTHTKGESDPKEHPAGIRTKDGHVHLLDGHHRAEHAHNQKKHIHVDVVDVDHVRPYSETSKLLRVT